MKFLTDFIEKIKEYSIPYSRGIRFKASELLVFNSDSRWQKLENLEAEEILSEGEKDPIELRDVLLDTGNTLGFCMLATEFKEPFNSIFFKNELEFTERLVGSTNEGGIIFEVSKPKKFCIFGTKFWAPIGFGPMKHRTLKNTLNIGIDCLKQFFNVLFFHATSYLYFCKNIPYID